MAKLDSGRPLQTQYRRDQHSDSGCTRPNIGIAFTAFASYLVPDCKTNLDLKEQIF